jgi:hypothetical protein
MGDAIAKAIGMQEASITTEESVKGVVTQVCSSACTFALCPDRS